MTGTAAQRRNVAQRYAGSSDGQEVGLSDNGYSRAASPFQPGVVIHGLSESLGAAQVPLCGLDGRVTEQELNLL